MNGVQTRFKCKLDVKRCKRFVFPPSSLLPRSNALKTKAIRYFQTDRTLTRIVSPPLPGQALVTLVDGTEKWVIANYKETQTTDMKRNQLVEVRVDAIPDVKFKGRIASISDATGASYSLIPQNNSAGNFVKVKQRIPVRIEFTENNRPEDLQRLRAGMNVECYVKQ